MTAPTHTLPGDVPGLLRRGSVVMVGGEWKLGGYDQSGVIVEHPWADDEVFVALIGGSRIRIDRQSVALSLHEPTSRSHALWWWEGFDSDRRRAAVRRGLGGGEGLRWALVAGHVLHGEDLIPDDLDTFARVMRAAVEVSRG